MKDQWLCLWCGLRFLASTPGCPKCEDCESDVWVESVGPRDEDEERLWKRRGMIADLQVRQNMKQEDTDERA